MSRKKSAPDATEQPKNSRPYIGRCSTLAEVRAEMSRLYRRVARACGPNPTADEGYKLSLMLGGIAKAIEGSELEARLAEVERRTAEPPAQDPPVHLMRRA